MFELEEIARSSLRGAYKVMSADVKQALLNLPMCSSPLCKLFTNINDYRLHYNVPITGGSSTKAYGGLPKSLNDTYMSMLSSNNVNIAAELSIYTTCAYFLPNTADIPAEISESFICDAFMNLNTLPFLFDGVKFGDDFYPTTVLSNIKAIEMDLVEYAQYSINIANCYLLGNGWPAARTIAEAAYNKATNVLSSAMLIAMEGK